MDHTELRDVLRYARDRLGEIRKLVAAGGHIETLLELDCLVGIAADEARRKLKVLEKNQ